MPDQLVADIMLPLNLKQVSINDEAAEASERVLRTGQSSIVEAVSGLPCAILSRKNSRRLLGRAGTLRDHYAQLTVTGLTLLDAPVEQLVKSIAYDQTIDGFIVMDAERPVGLLTMEILFEGMRSLGWDWSDLIPTSRGPMVNPPIGSSCYCCPRLPHQLALGQAKRDPTTRLFVCPTHDEVLIFKVPCINC